MTDPVYAAVRQVALLYMPLNHRAWLQGRIGHLAGHRADFGQKLVVLSRVFTKQYDQSYI
jgi:hypothetical protein